MDVEGVNGIDTQRQNLVGIFLAGAGRGGQNGYVNIFQFLDVFHYFIGCKFSGLVLCAIAAYNASYFEIFGSLQGLKCVLSDVAVTYDGCSDFLHIFYVLMSVCRLPAAKLHKII